MRTFISYILLFLYIPLFAQTPTIENVHFEQRTDGTLLVDIYYDLANIDDHPAEISIEASNDHGVTWDLPCTWLTGDVGGGIEPGADKHVVWDFYADNPDTSGNGYRIRVTAQDSLYEPKIHSPFMFHDTQVGNSDPFSQELGVNTTTIILDNWSAYEVNDDEWHWDLAIQGNEESFDHVIARIGLMHVYAYNPADWVPYWVDRDDLDGQVKEEYGEFVTEAVKYLSSCSFDIDLYLVELEANVAAIDTGITNSWVIDWIKWEVDLIKAVDPDAKIAIAMGNNDLAPLNLVGGETVEDSLMYGPAFINRMLDAGVDFDVIGFSIRSAVYDSCDSWVDMAAYVDTLLQFGKELYAWVMTYPAEPTIDPVLCYPRAGGYSEEWQAEQYVESLRFLLETEKVIGATFPLYDFREYPAQPYAYKWGLVTGEGLEPGTGTKRLSFDAVKEFWREYHQ